VHSVLLGRFAVNAIEMLKKQHREVEALFEEFESAGEKAVKTKERVFRDIANALALHADIEEKIFYPEAKTAETEEILRESVEEHLSVRRLIADVLEAGAEDEQFDAKVSVLKEQVEHHVEEEEEELFPKVSKARSKEELEEMGQRMQQMAEELESEGEPAESIPGQTDTPSQI
jgi:hemerythrin superfamily protein